MVYDVCVVGGGTFRNTKHMPLCTRGEAHPLCAQLGGDMHREGDWRATCGSTTPTCPHPPHNN